MSSQAEVEEMEVEHLVDKEDKDGAKKNVPDKANTGERENVESHHSGDSDAKVEEKKVKVDVAPESEPKVGWKKKSRMVKLQEKAKSASVGNVKTQLGKNMMADLNKLTASSMKTKQPKKPAGWGVVTQAFDPVSDFPEPSARSTESTYDVSSKPSNYNMGTRSSVISKELKREHEDRKVQFGLGHDLLDRVRQKRKMAHMLMKQIHHHDHSAPVAKPNTVLTAWHSGILKKKKKDFLLPKDRAAWLEFLVQLSRRRTKIQYLTNKELKKVIIRTRPNLAHKKHTYLADPDCPECFFWNENQVADWVESVGFPNLREAFLLNCITGRRLVTVDVNALRQMGMKYFDEMKSLAMKIREILGLPRPNILRAIMRIVPYEQYLKKRVHNGRTYDLLTFEKFCQESGFDYSNLKANKNAIIPCTIEVFMVPTGVVDEEVDFEKEGSEEEDVSLINAPTVEFVVRNSIIRNKIVTRIIEEILKSALVGPGRKLYGKGVKETMKEALYWGLSELGLDNDLQTKERLDFATSVAQALLKELHKTSDILKDIDQVERYIGEKVNPEKMEYLQDVAEQFMEDVMPIAAVLALGELDLEVIFRDATGMEEYIEEIIGEAQDAVENQCAEAEEFIREVCEEAYHTFQNMKTGFTKDLLPHEVQDFIQDIIEELLTNAYIIEAVGRGDQEEAWAIIAESQDKLTNSDENNYQIQGNDEQEVLEDGEINTEVPDVEEEDETKKSSITNLQTQVDNEVKIGHFQVSAKGKKERKQRTELTLSDSLTKRHSSQTESQFNDLPFRKVESDITLQKSPFKTTSNHSLLSTSTGEFSVNSNNMRTEYSQAFKQMANEKIKKLTEKNKLLIAEHLKGYSLPGSPLEDGEQLRKVFSYPPMKDAKKVEKLTKTRLSYSKPLNKEQIEDFIKDFDKFDDSIKKVIYQKINEAKRKKVPLEEKEGRPPSPIKQQDIVELLNNLGTVGNDDDILKGIVYGAIESRPVSYIKHLSLSKPLNKEQIEDFIKDFDKFDDSIKKMIYQKINEGKRKKVPLEAKEGRPPSPIKQQDIVELLNNLGTVGNDDDTLKGMVYGAIESRQVSLAKEQGEKEKPTVKDIRADKDIKVGKDIKAGKGVTNIKDPKAALTEENIQDFIKNFEKLDNSLKQSIFENIMENKETAFNEITENDVVEYLKELSSDGQEENKDIKQSIYTALQQQMLDSQNEFEKQQRMFKPENVQLTQDEIYESLREFEKYDDEIKEKMSERMRTLTKSEDIKQLAKKEDDKSSSKGVTPIEGTEGSKDVELKKVSSKSTLVSPSRKGDDAIEKKTDGGIEKKTGVGKTENAKDGETVTSREGNKGDRIATAENKIEIRENDSKLTVLFRGSKIEETTEAESSDADGIPTPKRLLKKENSPPGTVENQHLSTADQIRNYLDGLTTSQREQMSVVKPKELVQKTMSLQSVHSAHSEVSLNEKTASMISVNTDKGSEEADDQADAASSAIMQMMREKKLHRRQLVENWAQETKSEMEQETSKQAENPEEYARIMRITADQIVTDIVQLALTHMLLQAEAGKDKENILIALKKIQVKDPKDNHEHTVVLWDPNIPQSSTASSFAEYQKRKAEGKSHELISREGLKKASKEAIVSAIKGGLGHLPEISAPRGRHRFDKGRQKKHEEEEEITRL